MDCPAITSLATRIDVSGGTTTGSRVTTSCTLVHTLDSIEGLLWRVLVPASARRPAGSRACRRVVSGPFVTGPRCAPPGFGSVAEALPGVGGQPLPEGTEDPAGGRRSRFAR